MSAQYPPPATSPRAAPSGSARAARSASGSRASRYWREHPLCPEIEEIAGGSFKLKEPPEIRGAGYVVKSLEAALWAFYKARDFRDGALLAVNLGDDADTTGAVYGQIAGAFYGYDGIPESWRTSITSADLILGFADLLADRASVP